MGCYLAHVYSALTVIIIYVLVIHIICLYGEGEPEARHDRYELTS